jgi:hypothetical protein
MDGGTRQTAVRLGANVAGVYADALTIRIAASREIRGIDVDTTRAAPARGPDARGRGVANHATTIGRRATSVRRRYFRHWAPTAAAFAASKQSDP